MSKVQRTYSQLLNTPSAKWWQRHGTERKAGFQAFLPGIHSEKSIGCGEFRDIKPLIEWGKSTGHRIGMFTPWGPVGFGNSPFSARSSFALDPMFASLDEFKGVPTKDFESTIQNLRKTFPIGIGKVDYRFIPEKLKIARAMFDRKDGEHPDFLDYLKKKIYWLPDFALYEAIKQKEELRSWKEWPSGLRDREAHALNDFERKNSSDVTFHAWLQWQASMQAKALKRFAEELSFLLMGNLPFLAAEDSADVWALRHKNYFKMHLASGAPPDQYCLLGQRWGNPPLNWEVVEADNFKYFDEKRNEAANYYDLDVLDHVFGIARLWSIYANEPMENQGLNGFFNPIDPKNDEAIWNEQLKRLLTKMIQCTDKLQPVAENLGSGPKNCNKILKELGILGFVIPRWMKDWGSDLSKFISSSEYEELTAVLPGIHDAHFPAVWYETIAGTVDSVLFERLCKERSINFNKIKDILFDTSRSTNNRLRWRENINKETLLKALNSNDTEAFTYIHNATFNEQAIYWNHVGLEGRPNSEATSELMKKILQDSLDASSIFSLTPLDVLLGTDNPKLFTSGPRPYINNPGTTHDNWEHGYPAEFSVDKLSEYKGNQEILEMNIEAERISSD